MRLCFGVNHVRVRKLTLLLFVEHDMITGGGGHHGEAPVRDERRSKTSGVSAESVRCLMISGDTITDLARRAVSPVRVARA